MISVVIPTRNRAARLRTALDAVIAAGACSRAPWELIIVDNNSTDGTAEAIAAFLRDHPNQPVTSGFEPGAGLSRSRNQGILLAQYPIIAFTDDDCLVEPSWLNIIQSAFEQRPDLGILTGRVVLHDERDAPISTRDFDRALEIETLRQIRSHTMGCNSAIARTVFDCVGVFDTAFGVSSATRSAEDHELFYRALRAGFPVAYDPRMHVRHAHGRRSTAEVAAVSGGYLRGYGALLGKHLRRGDRQLLRTTYWEARQLVAGALKGDFRKSKTAINRPLWNFSIGFLIGLVAR